MYVYTAVRGRFGRAHAPHVCVRVCARARVRLGAHASAPKRASAFLSASTAGGSARRRSCRRRRSTRTSARGTPLVSPRCPRYAPPSAGAARHRGRPRVRYSCAQERWDVCTDVHLYTSIYIVSSTGFGVCVSLRSVNCHRRVPLCICVCVCVCTYTVATTRVI